MGSHPKGFCVPQLAPWLWEKSAAVGLIPWMPWALPEDLWSNAGV